MLVEVWSDVVCPWCYIGKRRLAAAMAELDADPAFDTPIEIFYRPYQLDPTAPPGTATPVAEAYARKFGGPERAAAIIEHVTHVAAEAGLTFHLDRAVRANTRDAHRLLWYGEQRGDPDTQADLKERLLAAYFVEGRNVGDPEVLADVATHAGLDGDHVTTFLAGDEGVAELTAALSFARQAGIAAVPTYVIDRRWSIPGAQDPAVFVQVITRLAERRAG